MGLRLLPYGPRAVLVEPDDPADVLPLAAAAAAVAGVAEVVPAARTLLVLAEGADALDAVRERLRELTPARGSSVTGPEVVIDVHYDGADLEATATELGLTPDELVARHSGGHYVVAFCGFAPGFAYLTGLEPALHVARLPQPRTRVPAGSVGIGGEFTGVYPRASPGGWRLLGRTDAVMWDAQRDPAALLCPGARVRFRPA